MLSDKIWITRKSRIYTEQRLIKANSVFNFLVIWYSSILVCMTIWNLKFPNEKQNIYFVFGSIAILIASILLYSQKYTERALSIRNCYLKLNELYSKVKSAEEKKDNKLIQNFEIEYTGIIENVENHTDYDYLCLRFSLRQNSNCTLPKFSRLDLFIYIFENFLRVLFFCFLLILPLGISYIWGLF